MLTVKQTSQYQFKLAVAVPAVYWSENSAVGFERLDALNAIAVAAEKMPVVMIENLIAVPAPAVASVCVIAETAVVEQAGVAVDEQKRQMDVVELQQQVTLAAVCSAMIVEQQQRHSAAPEAEKQTTAHQNQIMVAMVLLNLSIGQWHEEVAADLAAGLMYANSATVIKKSVVVAGLVAGKMANVEVIEVVSASETVSDRRADFVLPMGQWST